MKLVRFVRYWVDQFAIFMETKRVLNVTFLDLPVKKLYKMLEVAVDQEDYEKAAKIRDLINKRKKGKILENHEF